MTRHLGQSLLATLCHTHEAQGAHVVLLASAQPDAGKATLCQLLRDMRAPELTLLELEELETLEPADVHADELVVIHGPALLHGDGLARVPLRWIAALDGCVLIARRRHARTDDLVRVRTCLDHAGLPVLGVIYNTHRPRRTLAMMTRLRAWLSGIRARRVLRRAHEVHP